MFENLLSQDLFKEVMRQETESLAFGFYWENLQQILDQIKDECREVEEAYLHKDKNHLKEELGDLIAASLSLCIFCQMDPKNVLEQSITKYQKRFDALVDLVQKDGLIDLKNQPMSVLLSYWKKAKEVTI